MTHLSTLSLITGTFLSRNHCSQRAETCRNEQKWWETGGNPHGWERGSTRV